jgi:hypothetical protein
MARIPQFLVILFAIVGLAAIDGSALAQPKDKKDGKEQKVMGHKHLNGKSLVGDKIKKDGKQQFHQNGKHTAFVNVKDGKITGVTVTHSEKGNVPVKKYKSTKKMEMAGELAGGIQRVSFVLAQAQDLGTTWIGYSYFDDYGYETIYWFPYEMIYDGNTGAVDYVPLY